MDPLIELDNYFYNLFCRAAEIGLTISFSILLINAIKVFEDYIYHTFDLNKPDNFKERKIRTQLQFIRKVTVTLIVILTVAAVLLSFDNVRKIGAGAANRGRHRQCYCWVGRAKIFVQFFGRVPNCVYTAPAYR